MATPLEQFWQQEETTYEAERGAAQGDLKAHEPELTKVRRTLKDATKRLDEVVRDIAAKRAATATAPSPAQLGALNTALRDLAIEQRELRGRVLSAQESIATYEQQAEIATARQARATAAAAQARQRITEAQAAGKARGDDATKLAAAPLKTLAADADSFLKGPIATAAKDFVDATFPAELLTLVRARRATWATRMTNLTVSAAEARAALGKAAGEAAPDGAVRLAREAFTGAELALRDHIATAKARFDRAVSIVTHFADIEKALNAGKSEPPDLLTKDEHKAAVADDARKEAVTAAEPVDTERKKVSDAVRALDTEILTQISADVDVLATSAAVKTKRTAVSDSEKALDAAIDAFLADPDKVKTLAQWEVVFQDTHWNALLEYEEALATLTDLVKTKPTGAGSLLEARDKAEADYAAALKAAAKKARTLDALRDVDTLQTKRLDTTRAAFSARLLSAAAGGTL